MPFRLRHATDHADAIAELFFASYRLLTFLPMLHPIEGYRRFVAGVLLKECVVTVIEDDTGIISFLALQGEEIRQLYTRPDRIGLGAGTELIEAVKSSGVVVLELWCFQANARVRRFYEARGFRAIRFTRRRRQRGAGARRPLSVGSAIGRADRFAPRAPATGAPAVTSARTVFAMAPVRGPAFLAS
jgi:GNAT superfamily N-acetyltransferase